MKGPRTPGRTKSLMQYFQPATPYLNTPLSFPANLFFTDFFNSFIPCWIKKESDLSEDSGLHDGFWDEVQAFCPWCELLIANFVKPLQIYHIIQTHSKVCIENPKFRECLKKAKSHREHGPIVIKKNFWKVRADWDSYCQLLASWWRSVWPRY